MNRLRLTKLAEFGWVFLVGSGVSNGQTMKPGTEEKVVSFQTITVVEGLAHPWSMAFLTENEVLLAEKDGWLKRVHLQTKQQTVIAGFPKDKADSIRKTDPRDNTGIFEVLLDPEYRQNGWVYVSYAAKSGEGTATKVIRGKVINDSLQSIETLLEITPYRKDLFHYGGGMTFGKDGKLYITAGERYYNETDQPALPVAQDVTDRRGKIYRINPDGTIPADNPQFGGNAAKGLYAMGIRAAQGITLNPFTGAIWFSEHGSTQGDEINVLKPGANYGWPVETTGRYRNQEYKPPKLTGRTYAKPVWDWTETVAPTGLVFYTGKEFRNWQGNLLVAGLSRGSLWRLIVENEKIVAAENLFIRQPVRLRKVIQSPEGKLYVLTDEPNGKIVRIENTGIGK
ncbi:MAG: PQQ-dependent sugar dehydrogenase [Cytophagales bacterium]|nr:PQQ-dependent sugar dehydrogenase [Cytophagales bacterium]